jgi:hypothetical protein
LDVDPNVGDSVHIESHSALLQQAGGLKIAGRPVDAIIVPTIRPQSLRAASTFADEIGCVLVVLCTTPEQARQAAAACGSLSCCILITWVPHSFQDSWLKFSTSLHPAAAPLISSHADIARKRNAGLLLARLCGWRTVMYLDDDIRGLTAEAVRRAASLTSCFLAAGFTIGYYPDNSTVCHAYRLAGGRQDIFPGGSALLVNVDRYDSLFPSIYNEDWLFLFDAVHDRSVAAAGTLSQLEYNPFAHPGRAAAEEFGDVIAEGLYRLIHTGADVGRVTQVYWQEVLERRVKLIDYIGSRLPKTKESTAVCAQISLAAAHEQLRSISPQACVSFVRAWRADLDSWRQTLLRLPAVGNLVDAAAFLELPVASECVN